ncbi:MAG: hypothetical protein M3Z04_16270 [Chloroflexota bacterium]|nr:hypothetical protein [Chloroflexota bacterium]
MAAYGDWNNALLAYFVAGVPRGTQIFLSVDDDLLRQVGCDLLGPEANAVDDFSLALKAAVVRADKVRLDPITGFGVDGAPRCLAFLAAMVLAASRMADEGGGEGEIAAVNYFRRLREVLGLEPVEGRPVGLEPGVEEPLWQQWSRWLQEQGYVASARRGEGPRKYIDYPISQAIMRGADKDRLCRLFAEKRWSDAWEQDTVMAQLQHERRYLTQHLQELLSTPGLRYAAIFEAAYDVYTSWCRDPHLATGGTGDPSILVNTNLIAGLMRVADPFGGAVDYYLYARTPRRRRADYAVVDVGGAQRLTIDRPGWFAPLFTVTAADLDAGSRYKVLEPSEIEWLLLPQRDFWLLVPDPDNQEGEAFATWGPPQLGVAFMILCHRALLPELEHLRSERVLEWSGEPQAVLGAQNWVELRYCMVVSDSWSGIFINNQALHEALRPKSSLSLSVSGGLRAPHATGWLAGYGPRMTVFGFEQVADVQITSVVGEHNLHSGEYKMNVPFDYAWPGPGDYLVEAESGGEISTRLVKIVDWEDPATYAAAAILPTLAAVPQSQREGTTGASPAGELEMVHLGSARLSGAYLIDVEAPQGDDAD